MNSKYEHEPVDFDRIVREAGMERNAALGDAIANGVVAVSNGIRILVAIVSGALQGRNSGSLQGRNHADQPRL